MSLLPHMRARALAKTLPAPPEPTTPREQIAKALDEQFLAMVPELDVAERARLRIAMIAEGERTPRVTWNLGPRPDLLQAEERRSMWMAISMQVLEEAQRYATERNDSNGVIKPIARPYELGLQVSAKAPAKGPAPTVLVIEPDGSAVLPPPPTVAVAVAVAVEPTPASAE